MKLNSYISVIGGDEVPLALPMEQHGVILNAYSELPEDYLNNAEVIAVYSCFGGLCIEAVI